MGSFNVKCAVSNRIITQGDNVALFIVAKNGRKVDIGNMLLDSTTSYVPISPPILAVYDDYGYFSISDSEDAKIHNNLAFQLFKVAVDNMTNNVSDDSVVDISNLMSELRGKSYENKLSAIIGGYLENHSNLSLMPIDYNIYRSLVSKVNSEDSKEMFYNGDAGKSVLDYHKEKICGMVKGIDKVDDFDYDEYCRVMGEKYDRESYETYKMKALEEFYNAMFHHILFQEHIVSKEFKYVRDFYYKLRTAYYQDKRSADKLADFYAFHLALGFLGIQYGLTRYGNQTENLDYVMVAVKSTLESLRRKTVEAHIDGLIDLNKYIDLPKKDSEAYTEKELIDIVNNLDLDMLEKILNDYVKW